MDKLHVGIIGCGRIAGTMAETLMKMDSVVSYAAASRDKEKAAAFASKYGFQKTYGSYQELAADPNVDLVYIAVPHSHHAECARLCLENGRSVLCEKSFTVNAREAESVISLAHKKHLLITEAMWVRYIPLVRTLREVLSSGIIGELSMCTANLHYVIDDKPRLTDPDLAGGALLDVGVYALTFASIVFGDDVSSVSASAVLTGKGVDRQDSITLTYRDGKMAVLNCGMSALSDRQGVIYGRNGYIIVENINNFEAVDIYSSERKLIKRIPAPPQISGYEYEIEACRKAILSGSDECPEMTHDETIRIMKQMDEIRRQTGVVYSFEK